jgi:hypothetical protein
LLKINSKNNNEIFNVCILFLKIKISDLENSKYHIRFQHEEFNESDKLKFKDNLIYFFEIKLWRS